ncbi:MAG: class I SAM-dependent methyltransferase [Acaryochloris sp. RU_4_1]|nr:class I SAM-dependent methyltransferase [Acaryochloris sp. RU_4_1]NJR53979.1 class I SAM-dependent methyltransferase [Acaryochloris sp. CRU_2_0]
MTFSKSKVLCPLNGEFDTTLVESLKTSDITALYQKQLSIDVSSEFGSVQEISLYHCLKSDLKFFYPLISGSESFYEKLQRIDWYYLDEKYEYYYAQKFIRKTDHVLEIGCGNGLFAKQISVEKYRGIEFSQKAKLDAGSLGIEVLNESIQVHVKSYSSVYDVVCAFQVLEHVTEITSFIESSLLCLKPGGFLIYSVPSADSFLSAAKNNILNMPPHHVSWWSDKALTYISQRFELEIVDIKHERLADIHKKSYLAYIVLESLSKKLNFHFSLVNRSWTYRFFAKLSEMIATFLIEGMNVPEMLPNGHSVIAVYRKPKS